MKSLHFYLAIAFGIPALLAIVLIVLLALPKFPEPAEAAELSYNAEVPTATSVYVGKDIDTLVAASSTGRLYLEMSNISGATSTPQALYCSTHGRAATVYSGVVVHASTTRIFEFDPGAVRCRFPVASSTITVVEF